MEKNISFAVEDLAKIQFEDYDSQEFAIAKMGFLSTRPNSHKLEISEEVLKESASSVLGKWVVADMTRRVDAGTHSKDERIVGMIPKDQEVEFVYDDDGYLRAYVDTIISKIYAKDFCSIFEYDNNRAVSVEMKVQTDEDDDNLVLGFNIVGVTALGKDINPSCPQSDIEFVRFSEDEAEAFFKNTQNHTLNTLQKFVQERNQSMAKTYKIDKSKDAMSTADWGEVDKADMRDKIMEASNRSQLVKAVYALVEEGWEDAPSEHLKYPLMELKGDTFVYNRGALSSALAYAKQHNETAVVNKVEKIYKDLNLDDSEGKEDKKMSEIEFAAVNIDDLWCRLYEAMEAKHEYHYCIHGIYEEDNSKFAIICDRARKLYRLDFSLTEEGLVLADEIKEVVEEFIETDKMMKFAEPEDSAKYKEFAEEAEEEKEEAKEESEAEEFEKAEEEQEESEEEKEDNIQMSADELMSKISELEASVEEKENIIMDKDAELQRCSEELSELRKFKEDIEMKEKTMAVETIMSTYSKFMDKAMADKYREEGLSVSFAELDGWTNKVKASVVDRMTKVENKGENIFSFSAPIHNSKKSDSESVWDRL